MNRIMTFMAIAVMMLGLAACGSRDAGEVADRIAAGESLGDSDYELMNSYVSGGLDESIQVVEKAIETDQANPEADQELEKKYPYYRTFMETLVKDNKLSDSNKAKVQRLINIALTAIGTQEEQAGAAPSTEMMPAPDSSAVSASGVE